MKTITPADPLTHSPDVVASNIEQFRELFPEALIEGRLDLEVLKHLLGATIDERDEKYGLNWHGKRRARQIAHTPSTGTLRPCSEESVDWVTTQNLMIEGDNLEVLKLLQKRYSRKVKLIYIDPPYNTGRDFVYHDDYRDNIKNYLQLVGLLGENGEPLSSLATSSQASGRFHTDWLNMMYPRLKVAKTLMHPAGAIFVSCDDNELSRLLLLMDEVFGEENSVAQVVWQRSKKGDSKLIALVHEYLVCYVRDKSAVLSHGVWRRPKEGAEEVLAKYAALRKDLGTNHEAIRAAIMEWYRQLPEDDPRKAHKHYNWSDDRGLYFAADFAGPDDGRESRPRHDILHPVTGRPCKKPSTGWRWDQEKTNWALAQVPPRIHFGPDETTIPNRKSYLFEIDSEPYSSVFYRDGRSATLEVEQLVGKGWFPFPKNTDVLAEIIELVTEPDDIVLDFFAGSASTGHAVMKVNATHNSSRRFVMVQLPEPTGRTEYKTIADIAKKRLREAGRRIRADHPGVDVGFRVFKLDSTNICAWEPDRDNLPKTLEESVEHLKSDRTEVDILYELLLKLGLDLCVPIERKSIAGKVVHSIGGGVLIACLAKKVTADEVEALAQGMVSWHQALAPAGETTCVFRDSAFTDDVAKTNLTAILQQCGITNVRSI